MWGGIFRRQFPSPRFNSSTVQCFFLKLFFVVHFGDLVGCEGENSNSITSSFCFFFFGFWILFRLLEAKPISWGKNHYGLERERQRVVEFWWERAIIQTEEYWSNGLTSPSDHPSIGMRRIPASFFDFDVWQEYFIHLNPIFNAHSYIFTFLDGWYQELMKCLVYMVVHVFLTHMLIPTWANDPNLLGIFWSHGLVQPSTTPTTPQQHGRWWMRFEVWEVVSPALEKILMDFFHQDIIWVLNQK